ncbi:uncharacterized protein LOC127728328 [Mytilus californianus]|uniref:uncharacterized protein LOC127728328 n=1 Tax=Mytilus californianus TaxID=6549 RepID=UPI002246CC56|nr:uncharacterized protein LOC127728328 [Mytilus californianus]XP_052091636.1 uncharacterized protein LOC127728328 [Mytilus californianus]
MAIVPQAVWAEPQETWTNSWTCWTSEFLEEKEQSLDWDLKQILPTTSNTSMTSLRLDQKSSGPFDKEWNDMTMDMTNFKEIKKESLSLEDMNFPLDIDMPVDAHNMSEDDFLDSFMDLSEFLIPEQPLEEMEEVQNVIHIEPLSNPSFVVEPVPEESIICEEVVSPVSVKREIDDIDWQPNSDHDYVTKKPRLSPSPDTDVETTKIASTSTSKSINRKVAPDQKYRERRNKNNVASRRSRETRKMKFVEMEDEANRLVVVNAELREKIAEMEILAKDMKALLVQKLAAK